MSAISSPPSALLRIVWYETPMKAEAPVPSYLKMWDFSPRIISSPRRQCTPTEIRFPIVPLFVAAVDAMVGYRLGVGCGVWCGVHATGGDGVPIVASR